MTGFDVQQLGEIPDPYGDHEARVAAEQPPDPARLPPSPTRARLRATRAAALAGAILFEAAWLLVVEHRADLGTLPPVALALGIFVPAMAGMVALAAAMGKGAGGLGPGVAALVAMVCLPPVLFALGTLAAPPASAGNGPFLSEALRCVAVEAVLAAGPLALGLLAMRRSFASGAALRAGALGVACGALAATTMSIACGNDGRLHVLVGHGTMLLLAGLAGALAGARVTRA